MNLSEQLSLRTPLLWVTTDEPGRVRDSVVELVGANRDVFHMHGLQGFIRWNPKKNKWVQVLVVDPETGQEGPTRDLGLAVPHVLEARGILFIDNAHLVAEALTGLFTGLTYEYRDAVKVDDLDEVPAQLVLCSHKDELPKELTRLATHVIHELPDEDELERLSNHINQRALGRDLEPETMKQVVRAASGMSETEFVTTSLVSMRDREAIDPAFIATRKLDALKRGGLLEVRQPELGLDDLGGLDLAKKLIEQVAWVWLNPDKAKEFGIEPLRRMMLVGVPGAGKSALCEAAAKTMELDLAKGGVSNAMNKYVGESEANMRKMFAILKALAPVLFWIDEFGRDMSGSASSGSVDSGTTDRVHGEFLTGLQELPHNVFLMAAANRIEDLPPEMTRADRFDKIMFVGFPTKDEREDIFRIHLGTDHERFDVKQLAANTPLFTGAEIKALVREARFDIGTREQRRVETADLLKMVPTRKGRVWDNHREAIIRMYERAMLEWDWASSAQQAEANDVLGMAKGTKPMPTLPFGLQAAPKQVVPGPGTAPTQKKFEVPKWGT